MGFKEKRCTVVVVEGRVGHNPRKCRNDRTVGYGVYALAQHMGSYLHQRSVQNNSRHDVSIGFHIMRTRLTTGAE